MATYQNLLKKHNMQVPDEKVYFKVGNAKELIAKSFSEFVPGFKWTKEYDQVSEWLEDNKGLGLFLYGNCGRGKTMLAKYIIPSILLANSGKVLRYYDIQDLKTCYDEILSKKIFSLDDVGTEEVILDYGNRKDAFCEIMDFVEKKSKLIVITSNLTYEQLVSRYGIRIMDRIKATTKRILFEGESFR